MLDDLRSGVFDESKTNPPGLCYRGVRLCTESCPGLGQGLHQRALSLAGWLGISPGTTGSSGLGRDALSAITKPPNMLANVNGPIVRVMAAAALLTNADTLPNKNFGAASTRPLR